MSAAQACADEEDKLHALVKKNDDLEFVREGKKVRCKSTSHEMPTRLHIVQEYLNSKGYKKAKEWYSNDFSKYEPYIVPHRTMKKHLFCTLTSTTLPMVPAKIETHMGSKRFTEAKKEKEELSAQKAEKLKVKKALVRKMAQEKAARDAKDGKAPAKLKGKKQLKKAKKAAADAPAEAAPASSPKAAVKSSPQAAPASSPKVAAKSSPQAAPSDGPAAPVSKGKKRPLRSVQGLRKNQAEAAEKPAEAPEKESVAKKPLKKKLRKA